MSNNGISFIYRHKLHLLTTFEEYPQTTNFFFYGRCMMNKENETLVQKAVLNCLFLNEFLWKEKNRLCLGQVLGR